MRHMNPNSDQVSWVMGFNKNLKSSFYAILFLSLLLMSFLPPSSSHEIQPKAPSSSNVPAHHSQVFYSMNTATFFLNKQDLSNKKRNKMMMRRKKVKNFKTRPFSVMLPKGSVPPSGSSPCHNEYPDSVTLYCDLSTTKP